MLYPRRQRAAPWPHREGHCLGFERQGPGAPRLGARVKSAWRVMQPLISHKRRSMADRYEIDPEVPPSGPGCVECLAQVAGGFTCGAVRIAAISVVATRPHRSMRVTTPPVRDIRSSRATSLTRTGSGTTRRSSTSRGPSWLRRTITRSTSPCRDQPAACRQDGRGSCTDASSDAVRRNPGRASQPVQNRHSPHQTAPRSARDGGMERETGLEPATFSLEGLSGYAQ